jgi:Glycosyl transferase family 2
MVVVEAVRVEAIGTGAGVEMKLPAAATPALLPEPLEERAGVTAASRVGDGGEVIDVEVMTPGQAVTDAEARYGHRRLALGHEGANEAVARGPQHVFDVRDEPALILKSGTKLADRGMGQAGLGGLQLADLGGGVGCHGACMVCRASIANAIHAAGPSGLARGSPAGRRKRAVTMRSYAPARGPMLMIRKRLAHALDWRHAAVVSRLETLLARLDGIEVRTDERDAQTWAKFNEVQAQVRELVATVRSLEERVQERVEPMMRAVVEEEAENRRRLHALRAREDYEAPYTDPDPLVSVALGTWNRPELLRDRALPSLLGQTHANIEILVVGDAATEEVPRAALSSGDPRVRYSDLTQRTTAHEDGSRHHLVGSTLTRNEAVRMARGLWLLYFDDDDELAPDAIASLLELARERRAEVVYGGFRQHNADGSVLEPARFPPELGAFGWQGALVHSGLRFFERELVAADLGLPGDYYMLRRMLRTGVRFAMLDRVVWDRYPCGGAG